MSKRLGSPYVSGRTRHWLKFKNPAAPAVKRDQALERCFPLDMALSMRWLTLSALSLSN